MFGKKAQPKDEHEQPEIMVEEVSEEERIQQWNEALSEENGKPFCRQYEPDPSIISKVKR